MRGCSARLPSMASSATSLGSSGCTGSVVPGDVNRPSSMLPELCQKIDHRGKATKTFDPESESTYMPRHHYGIPCVVRIAMAVVHACVQAASAGEARTARISATERTTTPRMIHRQMTDPSTLGQIPCYRPRQAVQSTWRRAAVCGRSRQQVTLIYTLTTDNRPPPCHTSFGSGSRLAPRPAVVADGRGVRGLAVPAAASCTAAQEQANCPPNRRGSVTTWMLWSRRENVDGMRRTRVASLFIPYMVMLYTPHIIIIIDEVHDEARQCDQSQSQCGGPRRWYAP